MAPKAGIAFGFGRVSHPNWSEETFHKWYNTVKMPQMFSITNGPKAGYRFRNQDPSAAPYPFLTIYPAADIHTEMPDAADKLKLTGDFIPEGETFLSAAEWDVRVYEKIRTLEPSSSNGRVGNRILTVACTPGAEDENEGFNDHKLLDTVKQLKGYLRSHEYVLFVALTPEGLPDLERPVPKYLVIHEFDDTEMPPQHLEFQGPDAKRPIYQNAEVLVRDFWVGMFRAGDETVGL